MMSIKSVFLDGYWGIPGGPDICDVIDTKGLASLGNSLRWHLKQHQVVQMSNKVLNIDVLVNLSYKAMAFKISIMIVFANVAAFI